MSKRKCSCVVLSVIVMLCNMILWADSASAETKKLLIGDINPLTGPGAYWGTGAKNALDLGAEQINKAGGIVVQGQRYEIKFIHEDDKYTGAAGVAAANKLIFTDKVKFIVGPLSSASILAFQPLVEAQKIVMICDSYAGPELLRGKKYTFRGIIPSVHVAAPFMKWLKDNYPHLKKAAHLTPNDATGWGSAQFDNDAAVYVGMDIVANEYYERGTQDFTSMLTRIVGKKPDILCLGGVPPGECALIIKQVRGEFGFKGIIQHSGMTDPDIIGPIAGWENVEGCLSTAVASEGPAVPESMKTFYRAYKEKYGDMNSVSPHMYDFLPILVMGIKKADSFDPDKIVHALENLGEFDTIWGKGYFGGKEFYGNNHQCIKPIQISQIKNRKLVGLAAPMAWEAPPPMQKWR